MPVPDDSPLSIAANVAGLLTLVFAIIAAIYVRITYLRNSDDEYFRVKTSLSWYKTESAWLTELAKTIDQDAREGYRRPRPEYEMYAFVMDDLANLEERILELVAETEKRATENDRDAEFGRWALVPRKWSFTTMIAMSWLPVRSKALELVRQRDSLTARVQFTQMSMISSRIRDLEDRTKTVEPIRAESFLRMEKELAAQREQIQQLKHMLNRFTEDVAGDEGPGKIHDEASLDWGGSTVPSRRSSASAQSMRKRESRAEEA